MTAILLAISLLATLLPAGVLAVNSGEQPDGTLSTDEPAGTDGGTPPDGTLSTDAPEGDALPEGAQPPEPTMYTAEVTLTFDGLGSIYDIGEPVSFFGMGDTSTFTDSYYDQLDADSQAVYDALLASSLGTTGASTDEVTIPLSNSWDNVAVTVTTEGNTKKVSIVDNSEIENWINSRVTPAYLALLYDYPKLSWLVNVPYNAGSSSLEVTNLLENDAAATATITMNSFTFSQNLANIDVTDTGNMNDINKAIGEAKTALEDQDYEIDQATTKADKAKAIHDYVCNTVIYASGNLDLRKYQTVYSALAGDKTTVCAGYAKAFKVLCDEYGIPCVLVSGKGITNEKPAGEAHMWNYVQLDDNKWYAVDCTWDDQDPMVTDFFLAGSDTVDTNFGGKAFSASHEANGKFSDSEGAASYTFAYPELNAEKYTVLTPQNLTFPGVTDGVVTKTYGDAPFTLTATNSAGENGGKITYKSDLTSFASVDENGTVTILTAGGQDNSDILITATAAATATHAAGEASYTLTVNRAELRITGAAIASKIYGDNDNATVNSVTFGGLVSDETLTRGTDYTVTDAKFNDANAGNNKTVTVTVELTEKVKNYTLPNGTYELTGQTIAPATLNTAGATVADKVYDGTDTATVTAVTFGGLANYDNLTLGTDYTVTDAKFADANVGTDKPVTGTVTLIADGPIAKNYTLSDGALKNAKGNITIAPAAANVSFDKTTLTYGEALTVTVSNIAAANPTKALSLTQNQVGLYCGETLLVSKAVDASGTTTLTYNTKDKGIPIGANALTVRYGGSNNLSATDLGAKEITLNRKPLTASVTASAPSASKDYDGTNEFTDVALTLADKEAGDDVTATASGTAASANAGDHTFTPTGAITLSGTHANWYTAPDTVTGNVTIKKIAPEITITAPSTQMTGKDVTLTIKVTNPAGATNGFPEANEITVTPTGNGSATKKGTLDAVTDKPGEYTVTYTVSGDVGNTVVFTVTTAESTNYTALTGDTVKHTVTISDKYGTTTTLTADKTSITYGDTVTLTATVTPAPDSEGTPAGTVQFKQDSNNIGTPVALTSDTATLTVTKAYLRKGSSSFTAEFTPAAEGSDFDDSTSAAQTVTVTEKQLTLTGLQATDRVYDGTNNVILTGGTLEGVIGEDGVTVNTMPTSGTITDVNTGTNKPVMVAKPNLTGDDAGNYTLAEITGVTVNITPASLTIDNQGAVTAKVYDGTTAATVTGVTLSGLVGGDTMTQGTDYTVTGVFDDPNAGTGKTVTVTVALNPDSATTKNYALTGGTYELTGDMNKAAVPVATPGTLTVPNHLEHTYTYDLTQLLPTLSGDLGTVTYAFTSKTGDIFAADPTVDGNTLRVPIVSIDSDTANANVGSITVTITAQNYADFTGTITIATTNKSTPTGTPTLSRTTLTYGEALSSITLSGTMNSDAGAVPGTFTWKDAAAKPSVGSYTAEWLFTPTDTNTYEPVSGTVPITVNKATPTGTPQYTTISASGSTLANAGLTVGTISIPGTIAWTLPASTAVTQGTSYSWTFTPTDSANYNALNGSIVLWANSNDSGGGSSGGGSSGGGGGNKNTNTTTNTNTSNTSQGSTADNTVTTTTQVSSSTTGNTATATVNQSTVNDAITRAEAAATAQNATPAVEIAVDAPATATQVQAVLPTASLESVASSDVETLTISSPVGQITLDSDALSAVAEQAGEASVTVALSVVDKAATLTAAQQEAVGDAPVYDISIHSGDEHISTFGDGQLAITLPHTLGEGEDPTGVVVYYLDDAGNLQAMETTYDPATKTVTFVTGHLSKYVVAYDASIVWQNPFTDVLATAWYFNAVRFVNTQGLFQGATDTTFEPDASMTRAMLVTTLWRSAKEPAAASAGFTDVADGAWYAAPVNWAAANDVVSGVGDRRFAPDESITREQLAAILYRYAKAPAARGDLNGFTDGDAVSLWAQDAVIWAVAEGILAGDNGKLNPAGNATRAEVATVLQRYLTQ